MSAIAARLSAAVLARHGGTVVRWTPAGQPVHLADGYLPLLVRYTFEDAAAKGLRKLAAGHQPRRPEHFSALEMVQREPQLALHGEPGCGKSTLALHLALHLAGARAPDARFHPQGLTRSVPRNDADPALPELWSDAAPVPLYLTARPGVTLAALLAELDADAPDWLAQADRETPALLIIDGLHCGITGAAVLLEQAAQCAASYPHLRVLALADSAALPYWTLPPTFRAHALLPLLAAQRQCYRAAQALPPVSPVDDRQENPALFMLSLAISHAPTDALALCNAWLATFDANAKQREMMATVQTQPFFGRYLDAGYLAPLEPSAIADLLHAAPDRWIEPLRALVRHWIASDTTAPAQSSLLLSKLFAALLTARASDPARQAAANLVADLLAEAPHITLGTDDMERLRTSLLQAITDPALPPLHRKAAGHHLARHGDPRDLSQLVSIPAGRFAMGSRLHPNSSPEHQLELGAFRIGRYPVTNAQYARFAAATSRHWHSATGQLPHLATTPAVDLSWHDANAYCTWLTGVWHIEGVLGPAEIVRLATEPEWEYASRGHQGASDTIVYPWRGAWNTERGNVEDNGFNEPCPVGLFPQGRSGFGCDDMAGQVWEWTSTLWGADMATPSWQYPYADDGREAPQAAPDLRRVLRGGCFSSGPEKACCTYRGSLEPDGFWRGNGFRIVVSVRA
jgi:iron(II)-dependent oxidoreductase